MRVPRLGSPRAGPGLLVVGLVAISVFWIAFDNGSYGLESRNTVAIAVWWAFILVVAFGLARQPVSRPSLIATGLLGGLAVWTFVSLGWSSDAEATFNEFNRVTTYVGVFALVTISASRGRVGAWADALAIAVAAVAAVALVSRLFPGTFPNRELAAFLPSAVTRLSFPLGYWNGLAIFVALGVPLLLRTAVVGRTPITRGLALLPMPLIASVMYLASSRGGFATALVGSAVLVGLTERRWTAIAALATAQVGGAAAIAVLLTQDELVNGPLGTAEVERQGRTAAALVALVCLGGAAAYALGCRLLSGRIQPPRLAARAALVAAAAVAALGVALADPVERIETFTAAPQELEAIERGDFVKAHLLSGGGSGRWQFWSEAVAEWKDSPVTGGGAGSYEAWWAEHAPFTYSLKDAHSLYLEALGELGPVGFVLVLAFAAFGIVMGVRRSLAVSGDLRVTIAALAAVFTAYAAAAGFDWMWELTAVTALALVALALVCAEAAEAPAGLRVVRAAADTPARFTFRFGVGVVLAAWVLIVAQAIPLLAQREIRISQQAVEREDFHEGFAAAEAARDIQPWASSPHLQLALVSEAAGDLRDARSSIREALERDSRDWRLWLVSARLETKLGRTGPALRSLCRAAELNPRSPLFHGVRDIACR